jgi:hypothetical protein
MTDLRPRNKAWLMKSKKLKTKNANFADSIAKLQALNGSKDREVADTQKMILEENDFY